MGRSEHTGTSVRYASINVKPEGGWGTPGICGAFDFSGELVKSDQISPPCRSNIPHFHSSCCVYSRTFRKRPPIMSRICGRLREVVAYQRSDHRGSKFLAIYIW